MEIKIIAHFSQFYKSNVQDESGLIFLKIWVLCVNICASQWKIKICHGYCDNWNGSLKVGLPLFVARWDVEAKKNLSFYN